MGVNKQTLISAFIFFTMIMLGIIKSISRHLGNVVGKINSIANGDYKATVALSGITELNEISTSINIMAKSIDQKINELSNKNQEILKIMVEALEATDAYTKGHSERVALYVYLLGEKLNYPDMDKLISAALLHDIGKIAVPEHILNKPGKLLDEEYDQIKKHVDTGHRILNKSSSFNEIESLVHCHHERLDGKGYPRGLSGNSIPLGAQIISICDVYDALTSDRPYRKAMSKEKALAIIESEREKQFSSFLVDAFLSVELA